MMKSVKLWKRKCIKLWISILSIVFWGVVFFWASAPVTHAYTPTPQDINVTRWVINGLFSYFRERNRPAEDMKKIESRLLQLENSYKETYPNYAYTFEIARIYMTSFREKAHETWYTDNAQAFINKYWNNIITARDSPTDLGRCFEQYPLVDHTARMLNIPPSFVMATRYVESSCRMYNPTNGDWIFQIINNHYEPGDIDFAWLAWQLYDFEIFIERKFDWYNSRQPEPIIYWYNTYNIDTLQSFAALYNGVSGPLSAYPLALVNPYYFFGNYNTSYKSRRDWWLVFFMKILQMENDLINKNK